MTKLTLASIPSKYPRPAEDHRAALLIAGRFADDKATALDLLQMLDLTETRHTCSCS